MVVSGSRGAEHRPAASRPRVGRLFAERGPVSGRSLVAGPASPMSEPLEVAMPPALIPQEKARTEPSRRSA